MSPKDAVPLDVPVYGALIESEEIAAGTESLASGWLGMGEAVNRFEQAIADVLGCTDRHVVAVNTGSSALHAAMVVTGVGAGDEVVVPSLCHLSDVQAILACGATPVFCDVNDLTLTVDLPSVTAALSPRTRVVLGIDYGGGLIPERELAELGEEQGFRVVRDAAHAFGSSEGGAAVGSRSDLCIFSFDPVKSVTCIDGGALVLRNEDEAVVTRQLRILGSDQPHDVMYKNARTWDYDAVGLGYRYHLSNVHAAIGAAQIAKLDRIRANRQATCERYAANLGDRKDVQLAPSTPSSNPFLFWIRVDAEARDGLRRHLEAHGIGTGIHWRPAHVHTYFRDFERADLPVTERAAAEVISLPLHSAPLPERTIDRICDEIDRYLG
jgi:dTDP-4-amino-4,6-dideoxygalactose transaminase